ncbi:hypothetical protein ACOMHN_020623 [Nucella lapillus]
MASSASPPREWTSEVTAEKEEDVYNKLSDLEYFAVDSEGIHLSREGPLTLLQIAAPDGYVYLFDVLSRRECLDRHGRLGALLQSEKIVKEAIETLSVKLQKAVETINERLESLSAKSEVVQMRAEVKDLTDMFKEKIEGWSSVRCGMQNR